MIDRIAGSRLALAGLFLLALLIGAGAMWGIDRLSPTETSPLSKKLQRKPLIR